MSESEFGRGYATCLRQFVNHANRLERDAALYAELRAKPGRGGGFTNADLFSDAQAAEMWANGASDHLYEIKRPRRGVPRTEWHAAEVLAGRALNIGHGFRPTSKSSTDECRQLLADASVLLTALTRRGHVVSTLDEAMETDRNLGLAPQAGTWSCAEDLVRK